MLAYLVSILFTFYLSDSVNYEPLTPQDSIVQIPQKKGIPVIIDDIFIVGNKKTRPGIILRELSIVKGEVYNEADLEEILLLDKNKLINTRLFVLVDITILHITETQIDIVVNVSERWYLFPSPIFDLVDRNFNDWWQNQGKDLSRTNIGAKIYKNNFRGRNETLKLLFQFGFTRQIGISYNIPYIDKNKRHGISIRYSYSENKNIAIRTENNKPVFFDSEEILKISKDYSIGYHYRRTFYNFHNAELKFHDNEINDTIVSINPNYYLKGKNSQKYFELSYSFVYDKRDNASYPLKGTRIEFTARKQGLGIYNSIDRFDLITGYTRFLTLGKGFYFGNYTSVYLSLPDEQPYSNVGALGYKKDFIRGYELFLIESKNFILNRFSLKKQILSIVGYTGLIPIEQFRKIPLSIYFKLFFDQGYAENFENYNQNSMLSNRYLFGTGAGLDIVSYYDTVITLEYSMNREQDAGFFLHIRKDF
jgi:outer membrane protein assembly factor BamA